ncbi:hypothetical protein L6452_36811 [Arctium lappa]|uniref:Uncharacterized protein n=1 Tax=Arctium lappa TaxID=4217 RepID=A0ACB8Y1B5_ARCLA|nr:hypothetical protein L6452_36811 [Arctium lappa]
MSSCKPCATPVDTSSKLIASDSPLLADGTQYRSLAGALQYLTFTHPDITYAVQQGTLDYGLRINASPTKSLVAYSDADWGDCPDSRRSTSGYCVFLGDNLISWSSKRQPTISRSSAESEYRGVANVVAEESWIRNLLLELHVPICKVIVVYCDNVSAVYLSQNPVQHQRTKHVEMDIHFVREKVQIGHIRVLHVPSSSHATDWGGKKNEGCYGETEPVKDDRFWESGTNPKMLKILESSLSKLKAKGVNVKLINITQLTQCRKDAHPTVHRKLWRPLTEDQKKYPQRASDCTHWCLPGVPDIWNELLLAYIFPATETAGQ